MHKAKSAPVLMQGMDTYSNILYVKEQYVELSHLAHQAAISEKFRPETCCIIGNYYSLRGHHEKVRQAGVSACICTAAHLQSSIE